MIIPFIIGIIYFSVKAYRVKESIWLYGLLCGSVTGVVTAFFVFLFKAVMLDGTRGLDSTSALMFGLILTALAIVVVDRWSGLHWDIQKHNAHKLEKEEENKKMSDDEMAEIRRLQVLQDEEDEKII